MMAIGARHRRTAVWRWRHALAYVIQCGVPLCVALAHLEAQQAAPESSPAARGNSPTLPPVQFKVLLDVDYVSGEPEVPPPTQGFGLRRARLFAQVAGPAGLGFRLQVDPTALAVGPQSAAPYRGVPLVEAYIDYQLPAHFLVRVGQQRVPYTLDAFTGGPPLPTPEYNQLVRYTVQRSSAFRDIGVTVGGTYRGFEAVAGVFNGAGINVIADNDSSRDVAARISYAIVPGVQVGASAWRGHSGNLYVRSQGAPPVKAFYDNADFRRGDVDLHVGVGLLDLAAEYGAEHLEYNAKASNPAPNARRLDRRGYNVTGALRLGGIEPALRRVELVGRFDRWDPNAAVPGDEVTEYVAGLNFYMFLVTTPSDRRLGRTVNFVQRQSRVMVFGEWDSPAREGKAAPMGALLTAATHRLHVRWELFY